MVKNENFDCYFTIKIRETKGKLVFTLCPGVNSSTMGSPAFTDIQEWTNNPINGSLLAERFPFPM